LNLEDDRRSCGSRSENRTRALKSGAVFDALHLIAAERARADALLTFNPNDFSRLAQGERPKIVVPSAPPAELMPTVSGTNV